MEIESLLKEIDISRFPLKIEFVASDIGYAEVITVRIIMHVMDRDSGLPVKIGQDIVVSADEPKYSILASIYNACVRLVGHEFSECFRVSGELYRDEHTLRIA